MRESTVTRKTAETNIALTLSLEGSGESEISTGVGFLDHMLTLFAAHGGFGLSLSCKGDTQVDDHHTVEDVGICLGQAFSQALADKKGITRYGSQILPMDEALILAAVDLSGRAYLGFGLEFPTFKIGSFDTELVEEFFWGFVRSCPMSLHLRQLAGSNSHHIAEGAFKAFARAMKQAVALDPTLGDKVASTKGML